MPRVMALYQPRAVANKGTVKPEIVTSKSTVATKCSGGQGSCRSQEIRNPFSAKISSGGQEIFFRRPNTEVNGQGMLRIIFISLRTELASKTVTSQLQYFWVTVSFIERPHFLYFSEYYLTIYYFPNKLNIYFSLFDVRSFNIPKYLVQYFLFFLAQ